MQFQCQLVDAFACFSNNNFSISGEIQGTLHREAWDKFGPYLVIGSVLVLRQVAVYTAGTSTRQQYLNITAKSIAIIYPPGTKHFRD